MRSQNTVFSHSIQPMERITLTEANVAEVAARAAGVLRAGGTVLYPTDTLYGLGADALSDDAVEKIVALKGRDEKKPVHAIVADIEMAERYAHIPDNAKRLAWRFGGAVTLVCAKKEACRHGIARNISTFGFRIPNNVFCIALARSFGGPVTATSANRAGESTGLSVDAILRQLGDALPDLVVDAGELPPRSPSTVVEFSGETPRVLREGAVSADDIASALET